MTLRVLALLGIALLLSRWAMHDPLSALLTFTLMMSLLPDEENPHG